MLYCLEGKYQASIVETFFNCIGKENVRKSGDNNTYKENVKGNIVCETVLTLHGRKV